MWGEGVMMDIDKEVGTLVDGGQGVINYARTFQRCWNIAGQERNQI